MTALPTSPAWLLLAALIPFMTGAALMAWGGRVPRQGAWVAGLGLVASLIVLALGWSVLAREAFAAQAWIRGWIGPRDEAGAITVGVIRDALGLAMATATGVMAGSLLLGAGEQIRAQRPDRFFAALSFGAAGVLLAWFALTPWLALMGIVLTLFGGFLALGARWHQPGEAVFATRFAWERSWGVILALFGLCILAGGQAALSLVPASAAGADGTPPGPGFTDLLGAGLLFAGALVQLQPFPLLGWVMTASDIPCVSRIAVSQVLPAWAVLALLVRLDPQFREAGLFPGLGWVGLASALLSSVAGVFRQDWRQNLSAWVSAGFSLAVAALAFAGPSPALCIALGTGLGASALAGFGSALSERGGAGDALHRQRALWSKTGCGLAAAAGTGMVGFVSAGGSVRWLTFVIDQPALAAASVLVLFLFVFLGWKVAWTGIRLQGTHTASWASVLAPYLIILLALGVSWSGTATGGAVIGNPDRLFPSPLLFLFGPKGEAWGDESSFGTASALHWGALLVAIVAAYLTAGKREDVWPGVSRSLPRFSAFIASGYGVDPLFARFAALLSRLGFASQWLVDRKTWEAWIPVALATSLERGAAAVARGDSRLAWWIGGVLRRWVEAPSKLLQVIQNGDVQWYLFFAVASGIAILVHFMRG